MISACTTRSSLRRIKKEKIDHETEILFFFYFREYLNLLLLVYNLQCDSLVSSYFFGNVLEDHFYKSISTILGPIGQLI